MENNSKMIDGEKLILKLEKKIVWAKTLITEPPADKVDEIANKTTEDFVVAFEETIKIVREEMNK